MYQQFSEQTIDAIAEVVTGGRHGDSVLKVGRYRTGPELERLFSRVGLSLRIGNGSRIPTVRAFLNEENRKSDSRKQIIHLIELVTDPRDYVDRPEDLKASIEFLNKRLAFENLEVIRQEKNCLVRPTGANRVAENALQQAVVRLDLASVQESFERATKHADSDPASAITAACSTVESVCKCILDEIHQPYPSNQDIKGLVKEVSKHLNLSPGREDLPKDWESDIRQILSGLFSIIGGIGSLRTHAGDAHGRGKRYFAADARLARLAIHAASTISLFYLETWQKMQSTSS